MRCFDLAELARGRGRRRSRLQWSRSGGREAIASEPSLSVLIPGIRLPGGATHDQSRVSTPADAAAARRGLRRCRTSGDGRAQIGARRCNEMLRADSASSPSRRLTCVKLLCRLLLGSGRNRPFSFDRYDSDIVERL